MNQRITLDAEYLKELLGEHVEACTDDPCAFCELVYAEADRVKRACPFETALVLPTTIYGMFCGNSEEPLSYAKVVMAMLILIDMHTVLCQTGGDSHAREAKERASPFVYVLTPLVAAAETAYRESSTPLTFMRMLEARVCMLHALINCASDNEPQSTLMDRMECASVGMFETCGSIAIVPAPEARSSFDAHARDAKLREIQEWNADRLITLGMARMGVTPI